MYRIFCKSYNNYLFQYTKDKFHDEYRFKIAKSLKLLTNPKEYKVNKENNSLDYQKVNDLLFYMNQHINEFPKFKAFLWTLESRGMKGKYFGVTQEEDLREQIKLINMFLNLLYWED